MSTKIDLLVKLYDVRKKLLSFHNGFVQKTDQGLDSTHEHVQTTILLFDDLEKFIQKVARMKE